MQLTNATFFWNGQIGTQLLESRGWVRSQEHCYYKTQGKFKVYVFLYGNGDMQAGCFVLDGGDATVDEVLLVMKGLALELSS